MTRRLSLRRLMATLSAIVAGPAAAQTSVSLNLDYAEGRYGEPGKSTAWTLPLIVKHRQGDFAFKASLPYVRTTGTAVAGGDRFAATRQVQEGFGDLAASVAYGLIGEDAADVAVDVGVKAKFATADRRLDLITTGRNDYSLFVDVLRRFGGTSAFGTLGRTRKGDPAGVDYRDPWFATAGLSHGVGGGLSVGALYDAREKVTADGDPVREASVFLEWNRVGSGKVLFYLVRGFSRASPDVGAGATFTVRF